MHDCAEKNTLSQIFSQNTDVAVPIIDDIKCTKADWAVFVSQEMPELWANFAKFLISCAKSSRKALHKPIEKYSMLNLYGRGGIIW